MFHSRYLVITVLVALAGVGLWAAVSASGSHEVQARAEDPHAANVGCGGCQAGKIDVPADPQEREAVRQKFEQEEAARDARLADEARARANEWKGCRFEPSAPRDNSEEYSRQKDAASLFSADPTAPQGRIDFFRSVLSRQDFRLVGWEGTVAKVVAAADGKTVEFHVRPSLMTTSGRPAFTPLTYRETWKIDDRGRLSFEKGQAGGGPEVIMTD